LRQALIAAGVGENLDELSEVHLVRRRQGQLNEEVSVDAAALMKDSKGDRPLRAGDQIMVLKKKKD
jgi:hypothetical protein